MGFFGRIRDFFVGSSDPNKFLVHEDRKAVENLLVLAERVIKIENQREHAPDPAKVALLQEEGQLIESLHNLLLEFEIREYERLTNDITSLDKELVRFCLVLEKLPLSQGSPTLPRVVDQLNRTMTAFFRVTNSVAASPEIVAGFDPSMLEKQTGLSLSDVYTLVDSIRARQTDQVDLQRKFDGITKQIAYLTKNVANVRSMVTLEYDLGVFTRMMQGATQHDDADVITLLTARLDGTRTILSLCRKLQWDLEGIAEAHARELETLSQRITDDRVRRAAEQAAAAERKRAAAIVTAVQTGSAGSARTAVARFGSMQSVLAWRKTIATLMSAFVMAPTVGSTIVNVRGGQTPPAVTAHGFYGGEETSVRSETIPGTTEVIKTTREEETTHTVITPSPKATQTTASVKLAYAIKALYKFASVKGIVNGPEVAKAFEAVRDDVIMLWQQSGIQSYDDFIAQTKITTDVQMFDGGDKVGPEERNTFVWGKGRGEGFAGQVADFFEQIGISGTQFTFHHGGEPSNHLFIERINGATIPALQQHIQELQRQITQLNAVPKQANGNKKQEVLLKTQLRQAKATLDKKQLLLGKLKQAIAAYDVAIKHTNKSKRNAGIKQAIEDLVRICHSDPFLDNEYMLPDRLAEAQIFVTLEIPRFHVTEEGQLVTVKEKKTVEVTTVKMKDPFVKQTVVKKGTYNPADMPKQFSFDPKQFEREQAFAARRNTAPSNVPGAIWKGGGGRGGTGGRGAPFIGK